MPNKKAIQSAEDLTSLDDVRRVRERLSAEFDNDIRRLAEHAQRVAEQYQASLRLKVVAPSIKQFETGTGDYATERHDWVDRTSLADLKAQVKKRRRQTRK